MNSLLAEKNFVKKIQFNNENYNILSLKKLALYFDFNLTELPLTIKYMLEFTLKNYVNKKIGTSTFTKIVNSLINQEDLVDIPIYPTRILLEDNAGTPLLIDLASIKDELKRRGINKDVSPKVKTTLVIDHGMQTDFFGTSDALKLNVKNDLKRNIERYHFLNWCKENFDNLHIFPPNSGISHQINLEYLSEIVNQEYMHDEKYLVSECWIGSDSHTPMVNSLGVYGWGAGGFEVESAILGEPTMFRIPNIIGVEMVGEIKPGITSTDIALYLTEKLRSENITNMNLEFFGEGLASLQLADRATLANMAPEYGANTAMFPIDEKTYDYLRLTGREEGRIELIKRFIGEQDFKNNSSAKKYFRKIIKFDLGKILPCISGPSSPDQKIVVNNLKRELKKYRFQNNVKDNVDSKNKSKIIDGSILISAITSCTNTSNPYNIISAALLARNAVLKGLKVPSFTKTSFSPGSRIVKEYLIEADLLKYMNDLGFNIVGFGCSACGGSGGDIKHDIIQEVEKRNIKATSIISGNRNFAGRVHPKINYNFLASPLLVVAYTLVGNMNTNIYEEKIGIDPSGNDVYFKDIYPDPREIETVIKKFIKPTLFIKEYETKLLNDKFWSSLEYENNGNFKWNEESTYIRPSPFVNSEIRNIKIKNQYIVQNARALLFLGDNINTDHISPAGVIEKNSPAGKYLTDKGVKEYNFNTYGSRRGNHEVMVRGTFSSKFLENKLVRNITGGYTKFLPTNEQGTVYEVAEKYRKQNTDLIIIAGNNYGVGSSRDWAAKGVRMLGVSAIVAKSFERIHRRNLISAGILPLALDIDIPDELQLDGTEHFSLKINNKINIKSELSLEVYKNKLLFKLPVTAQIFTQEELNYFDSGGLIQYLIKKEV